MVKNMNYQRQLHKVIDYIGKHLDEKLTLTQLSDMACFSKYHFHHKMSDMIYAMYRDWLPSSGEELGDLPCIFCYYNFEHEVAETELLTECWLLLK